MSPGFAGGYLHVGLDFMEQIATVFDLTNCDSPDAFPIQSCKEPGLGFREDRIRRVAQRLARMTGDDWRVTGSSVFQDGARFADVVSGQPQAPTAFLFSKFGDLFTTGRFGDPPYRHSTERIDEFISVISADYGFKFASPHLLNQDYQGVFVQYRVGTWFQRFFVDVYWKGAKSHEGKLRWP